MAFRLVNNQRMMKPGKCIICETHPAHRVVDTGYNNLRNTVSEIMRGRKLVCEGCGEKIGKAFGMVVQSRVNQFKEEIIELQNRQAELEEQVTLSEQVEALRAHLLKADDVPVPE